MKGLSGQRGVLGEIGGDRTKTEIVALTLATAGAIIEDRIGTSGNKGSLYLIAIMRAEGEKAETANGIDIMNGSICMLI